MTFLIAQFALSTLLGYTVYARIVDRLSLSRPRELAERPRWLLGLGTGLSIIGFVTATMHRVSGLSPSEITDPLPALALALALALATTLAATGVYRFLLAGTDEPPAVQAAPSDASPAWRKSGAEMVDARQVRWSSNAERFDRVAATLDEPMPPPLAQARHVAALEQRAMDATAEAAHAASAQALEREQNARDKADADARAERESDARLALQTTIAEQRQDLLRAHRNLRSNVEARARALSAATRSLQHAKRSARARQRLESELVEARRMIANAQETIGNLRLALEKEQARTREAISARAAGLHLQEEQALRQRRSLDRDARRLEGRLGSRLVKKIAKARPRFAVARDVR